MQHDALLIKPFRSDLRELMTRQLMSDGPHHQIARQRIWRFDPCTTGLSSTFALDTVRFDLRQR